MTGGTGALGGHAARWVAGQGAGHVVLTSRRGLAAAGAAELAAQVSALGAAVSVVACDVGDRAAVAGLLARLAAAGWPVTAVMHTAGVLAVDALLDRLTVAELAAVRGGQGGGAAHLDELTAGLDLDAFVLFSSVAGDLGQRRAGGVRGGERVPGRAGRAAPGPGAGRDLGGVGAVGAAAGWPRARPDAAARGGGCG